MFFDNVRVLIFAHQNRVRSIFLEFLYIVEGVTELVIYVFGVLIGIIYLALLTPNFLKYFYFQGFSTTLLASPPKLPKMLLP